MLFSEFLFIEKLVEDLSIRLDESIFSDLDKVKSDRNADKRIDILSKILFYVKMHSGSAGNTDLKKFYTDIPIENKVAQIETTIKNHQNDFKRIRKEVRNKFDQKKEYEIYNSIARFFEHPKRIPNNLAH